MKSHIPDENIPPKALGLPCRSVLSGRTILITGGAQRIGAELCKSLAQTGARILLHYFQSHDAAQRLLQTLARPRGAAEDFHRMTQCDLGNPNERNAWLASLPEELDFVVNNASCYRLEARGSEPTQEQCATYWEVNFEAPLSIISALAARKKPLSSGMLPVGGVVNFVDADVLLAQGGVRTQPLKGAQNCYLATKQALALATLELAKTLAPELRVNAIAPGPVLPPHDLPHSPMTQILQRVPLAHKVALDDLTQGCRMLLENNAMTGVILPIDGGMHLGNL